MTGSTVRRFWIRTSEADKFSEDFHSVSDCCISDFQFKTLSLKRGKKNSHLCYSPSLHKETTQYTYISNTLKCFWKCGKKKLPCLAIIYFASTFFRKLIATTEQKIFGQVYNTAFRLPIERSSRGRKTLVAGTWA